MALLVQKFGGTSVGTTERIEAVAELLIRSVQAGHKVVAVVSAMAGDTNRLLGLARQIDARASARELDVLAASGEQVTVALLAIALIKRGYPAVSLLADQVGIYTDNKFGKARIERVAAERLQEELQQGHIVVVAGFQGRDVEGNLTTLGRGGSDTSAVAIAAAIQADECQIFTDVDGVYTIDPRICPQARRIQYVPVTDMLTLAHLGAKVLHSRSVEYAEQYRVPLRVLSTFRPDSGTLISYQSLETTTPNWSGIACLTNNTLLQLDAVSEALYWSTLELCKRCNVDVDMQEFQQSQLQLVVSDLEYPLIQDELQRLVDECNGQIMRAQSNLAKLSLVGQALQPHTDYAKQIEVQLQELNAQIWALYQSPGRFSALISAELLETAASRLHQKFFVDEN